MRIPSITLVSQGRVDAELLVVGCFQDGVPEVGALADSLRRAVEQVVARPGWRGREEQVGQTAVVVAEDSGVPASREEKRGRAHQAPAVVAVYGLGMSRDFTFQKVERWLLRVADEARREGVRRLAVVVPRHEETLGRIAARRVLRAVALSGYRFEQFRSEPDNWRLEEVVLLVPAAADYQSELGGALKVAAAAAYTRDLANTPGNLAHPEWMEEQARALAESHGMEIKVLDAAQLARRRMGGLLAVGGGAEHAPRLLRLSLGEKAPKRKKKSPPAGPVTALVGKGVTFDTGGISIKPAADMEQMKFDKCGACAVLGAMRAASELELAQPLRAYLPIAENMLSAQAYRPGDIVRCYNGKTVEITNTDAEGRMILADALSWAAEEGATSMVELSTLTGACVVALGHHAAGLFSPDDGMAGELASAGAASGERLWRLPLLPEFLDDMKSLHADLRNSAGRWGGASTAAAFLSQFTGEVRRWAHLDIAGVAYATAADGHGTAATGFGVATLLDWLRRES